MKIAFKIILPAAFLILVATKEVDAQDSIVIKTLPPVTVTAATLRVPPVVWKNFADYFTGAYNSRFFRLNRDYLAKFILNNQENRALFTKRGSLVYNIAYGYERNLPEDLRRQVKTSYLDYEITRAIKVTEANRVIWVLNLETKKKLIIVRLEDGDLEEAEQLDKL